MPPNNLFRQEVIDNKRYTHWGSVFINTPMSYQVISGIVLILMIAVIVLIKFGEFSEKYKVSGYINSHKGNVRIFPDQSGLIKKSFVYQGKKVKKDDVLFIIDTSYKGLTEKQSNKVISQLIKTKKSYQNEIAYKSNQLQQLKKLLPKKYISLDYFNQKQTELITLKNTLNKVDMDLIQHQQSRAYQIKAPITGTVANNTYKEGQYVSSTRPLLKLLPANSAMEVELFIPVSKSGFIHKNANVLIHYDAYPYERFGTYKATIKDISQSILSDDEEDKPIKINEPYYKATAQLEQENVHIYGKNVKIHDGMTLTGIILGSKRNLWQWILDPIYSFYGEATV